MLPRKALGTGPPCLSQHQVAHQVAGGGRAPRQSRPMDASLQSPPPSLQSPPPSSRLLSLRVSVSISLSKARPDPLGPHLRRPHFQIRSQSPPQDSSAEPARGVSSWRKRQPRHSVLKVSSFSSCLPGDTSCRKAPGLPPFALRNFGGRRPFVRCPTGAAPNSSA